MNNISWITPYNLEVYKFLQDLWSRDLGYEDVCYYVEKHLKLRIPEEEWEVFSRLLDLEFNRVMEGEKA